METKKEGYHKGGCNSVPMPSVFADQTPFCAANDPKTCLKFPPFQKDLFLLRGFSCKALKKKGICPFGVDFSCGRGSGAPMKIKRACLQSKEGAFEFPTVPVSSTYPWS